LAATRERALTLLHELVERKQAQQNEALLAINQAGERVRWTFMSFGLLTLAGFAAIGYFTAQSIRRPARDLLTIAEALRAGDYKPALSWSNGSGIPAKPRSEMTRIALAFRTAAMGLDQRERRLRADANIAAATGSSLEKVEVANAALQAIADHVGAEVGVIYWAEDKDALVPIAGCAINGAAGPIRVGEGILGAAARERRVVLVKDVPEDTPFAIRLGYDAAPPRTIAAVPISRDDELLGVVVLASLKNFNDDQIAFLEAASVHLCLGFQNIRAHEAIERLAADLSERNQQIQAQNEEIQAQNEEVQAQQEELQAQSEELQAQNNEIQSRSEDLEQVTETLKKQASDLAEADQRKNEFLAMLGHELRNPMAALTMSLEVLNRSEPGSKRAEQAQTAIQRQIRQLGRLLDDLLDVTRISRGKLHIKREPLDLTALLRGCVDDHRPLFDEKGIALRADLPESAIYVEGDRERLHQIASNLLHNASKFTDAGGETSLELKASNGQAIVRVADNGAGVEAALLPELFQPFKQGTAHAGKTNGGVGLGLTLVKNFAELHGGEIEALSDGPGKGAEFIVRLPTTEARPSWNTPSTAFPAPSRRILLIEDDGLVAWSMKETLEMDGHEVEIMHTGQGALEKARDFLPEVVLCDLGLPGLDGYAVAQLLRADQRLKDIPLIAVSGYGTESDKERARGAGFSHQLVKPVNLDELRTLLAGLRTIDMAFATDAESPSPPASDLDPDPGN
jgi:signal transduction histidine kinase/ActR/RegA family two-component response regulator